MQKQTTQAKASPKKQVKVQKRYQNMINGSGGAQPLSADKIALLHSRYLHSVLDPWNVMGAKIPDEITTPSFPMNVSTKIVATTAAGGGAGPTGRGIVYIVGSTGATNANKYMILNATATADTYQTAAPAGNWTPGQQLVNVAQSARPVSAGLFVNVQGSFNNNQGRIIIGFMPPFDPDVGSSGAAYNITATTLDNKAFSTSFPVTKIAGRSIYLPMDDIARSYEVSGSRATGTSRQNVSSGAPTYGLLFCLVDGTAASVSVEFTFSENFEVVPISSQVNIVQPEVSSSDPLEMALASNFIAKRPTIAAFQPTAGSITGTPLSGGQVTRPEPQQGTIMDKILSGLLTGAKVAAKVAPVAAELLTML